MRGFTEFRDVTVRLDWDGGQNDVYRPWRRERMALRRAWRPDASAELTRTAPAIRETKGT